MTAPEPPGGPARATAMGRVLAGALVLAVLAYSYGAQRAAGRDRLVDFLGYFTNLTSLLAAVLLVAAGAVALCGRPAPPWLPSARGVATACLLVVAVVYDLAVTGAGGTAAPWVSAVLHVVLPVVALLDWVLGADRAALPWRRLWLVLPYPLVWLVVVLVRGATDGWVPYGFLLPEHGARSLALHVAGLLVVLLAAGALVWAAGRVPVPGRARVPAHHP
ncbi:Pr6Pr family membrane protein [Cellulomonas telluris]|uniref:Pr6Pr family membrane protein n=1 Tax=Cellulomonas telluris TaxID=2306636 RepID=UPI001FE34D5F|nr:Pr6Pr family membrane protein [Cellulomonas telluris]